MHYLVIDMTHGGVKIAISLAKKGKFVYAYDIYNTLNDIDKRMLEIYNVELIDLNYLKNLKGSIQVISPVHLPLSESEISEHNPDLNYEFITHHDSVRELLSDWGSDIAKIEVTGVKGKTSSVFMLKEVLIDENPLILSSLGAILYTDEREIVLKKNISITPANIKETIDLAYKVANPICEIADGTVKSKNLKKYSSAIFESSLGVTGIGDVGLLTNISENYPIAKSSSNASRAKSQVFKCDTVVIEKESYDEYYTNIEHSKVNTFSLDNHDADLFLKNADFSLDETVISMRYSNVNTVNGNVLEGEITVKTFAPGRYHVSNVLGVVLTCLCLEIKPDKIINGLGNYRGIAGRTNKKIIGNSIIIEEINPGINTQAIKEAVEMIGNYNNYIIAVGGDYGITCEEIDEVKVAEYLDTLTCDVILTGDVGCGIADKMSKTVEYVKDYSSVYDLAVKSNKNLLFIYRSDYRIISKR